LRFHNQAAWNARALAERPIVRRILNGRVIRVRLDRPEMTRLCAPAGGNSNDPLRMTKVAFGVAASDVDQLSDTIRNMYCTIGGQRTLRVFHPVRRRMLDVTKPDVGTKPLQLLRNKILRSAPVRCPIPRGRGAYRTDNLGPHGKLTMPKVTNEFASLDGTSADTETKSSAPTFANDGGRG
jgi:hypothetical protein